MYPTEVRTTLTRASAAAVRCAAYIVSRVGKARVAWDRDGLSDDHRSMLHHRRCALSEFTYAVLVAVADRSTDCSG